MSNPIAYAVFAENGNIRIWAADPVQVETLRQQYGDQLIPLVPAPVERVEQDHDAIALDKARNIMQIMYGEMPKGGSAQLLAMVQVCILEAMSHVRTPQPAPVAARKAPPEDPLCGIEYRADGEANFYTLSAATGSWFARIQFNGRFYPHEQERILSAMLGDRNVRYGDGYYDGFWASSKNSAAAQDVAGLPFVRKILEKLERFSECAEDDEGVDIGRHWLDVLTRLGLLNRVQRSPARWEMTTQADDALEAAHQQREVGA